MIKIKAKKILDAFMDLFDDAEDPNVPEYDPVHIGMMIVVTIFGITILFWLLWALLVFGGGIQAKILPFLIVVFTSKTVGDYGYIGYPYEMGIFEGWPTNIIALIFTILSIIVVWYIYNKKIESR